MKMFEHKGYLGSIEASVDDGMLFGKLEFISALVNYEGETVPELKAAFEVAVDDYLTTCAEKCYEPEIPCKGSYILKTGINNPKLDIEKVALWHTMP